MFNVVQYPKINLEPLNKVHGISIKDFFSKELKHLEKNGYISQKKNTIYLLDKGIIFNSYVRNTFMSKKFRFLNYIKDFQISIYKTILNY